MKVTTQEESCPREAMTSESGTTMLFHEDNQMVISYIYNCQYSNYRRFGDNVNLATTSSQTGFVMRLFLFLCVCPALYKASRISISWHQSRMLPIDSALKVS